MYNQSDVVQAYQNGGSKNLKLMREVVVKQKKTIDGFMERYLDQYGGKMNASETKTPIWALYNKKLNEYEQLGQLIRVIDYYLSKP